MREGGYKNGLKNGVWREYYLDGHEVAIGNYKNGLKSGSWKAYHNTRMNLKYLKSYKQEIQVKECSYSNDLLTGPYYEYYEDGSRKIIRLYLSGKKTGKWQYFEHSEQ